MLYQYVMYNTLCNSHVIHCVTHCITHCVTVNGIYIVTQPLFDLFVTMVM